MAADSKTQFDVDHLHELLGRLKAVGPKEWRSLIGEALGVDLADLDTEEGLQALVASLQRREHKRMDTLLKQGDTWSQTREQDPEPFPPNEPVLPHLAVVHPALAEHGRSRRKLVALHEVGIHSAEGLTLKNELAELGMERDEYDQLIRRFSNAVRRKVVVSRGTDACPVCAQFVVNPTSSKPIRWVARGFVNSGLALLFCVEFALVGWFGYLVVLLVARLLGLWSPD
jgi:hypothetical protein